MNNNDRAAVVTGDSGFLGRAVVAALKCKGWFVAGLGNAARKDGGQSPLADARVDGEVSPKNLGRAIALCPFTPQIVMHAAGNGRVADAHQQPAEDFRRSVLSLADTLDAVRLLCPHAKLVFPSSAAVYGQAGRHPIGEDHPLVPVSVYGLHKQLCEHLISGYARQYELQASIVRYFSLYGPGLRKQLIWDICEKASTPPNEIVLSGDGTDARDFLHIEDAARLAILAAERNERGVLIVNGGSGTAHTVADVGSTVAGLYGVSPPRFDAIGRPWDPNWFQANTDRAVRLGFCPQHTLAEGLMQVVRWHRSIRGDGARVEASA